MKNKHEISSLIGKIKVKIELIEISFANDNQENINKHIERAIVLLNELNKIK